MAIEQELALADLPREPLTGPSLALAQARAPAARQAAQSVPAGPDLSKAPKWADVQAKPEFAKLPPEKQVEAKAAYFDYWIAPNAGQQAASLRQQFMGTPAPEQQRPQQPQQQPDGTRRGIVSDVGNLFGIGVNSMAQDVRELVGRIPGVGKTVVEKTDAIDQWASGKSSDELLKGNIKSAQQRLTPEMQSAGDRKWWDSDKGTFGDAWSDPRSYVSGVVQSLPEQALTMLPAMRLAKGIYASKIAAGVAPEVAAAASARAATIAGGVSEGALGGAQSSRQVRDKIMEMKPEQLQNSEALKALKAQGMSFDQAREQLANDSATQAFMLAGITTGMFGGMGDRMLAKAITEGVGKNIAGRVAKGVVGEGLLEEFPQSYTQAVSENIAMRRADPSISLTHDALNQGLGGLAVGALQGGGMAAGFGHNAPAKPSTPDVAQVEPTAANVTVDGRLDLDGATDHSIERDAPLVAAMREAALTQAGAPADAVTAQAPTAEQPAQAAAPVEPAPAGVHPSQAAADAIVRQIAQEAGIPMDTVFPTPAAPSTAEQAQPTPAQYDSTQAANQDVLDFAASRYQQLRQKRDGQVQTVMTDSGLTDQDVPGVGLSERDAQEMAALEANRGDANALRALYGFDQQAVATPAPADAFNAQQVAMPEQVTPEAGMPAMDAQASTQGGQIASMPSDASAPTFNTATTAQTVPNGVPAFNARDTGPALATPAQRENIAALEGLYDTANQTAIASGQAPSASVVHPFVPAQLPDADGIAAIASAFGKEVVGFSVNPGQQSAQFGNFNGVTWPSGTGNRVFINADTTRPHFAVLGHEIAHQMAKDRPELYARMVEAIRPYIDQRAYQSGFARSTVAQGAVSASMTMERRGAAVREEFIGEVLSDGFMDANFWRALGAKNKQLLAQVQAFVARMLQKVLSTVGYTSRTAQYLTDYQRVMQIAGEVMAEYGLNQDSLNNTAGIPKFMFAGEKAATADTDALTTAKRLVAAGQNPDQVRRSTGWHQGPDKAWRFEIDDSGARLASRFRQPRKTWGEVFNRVGNLLPLGAVIEHPSLFAAYPSLKSVQLSVKNGSGADFNTQDGIIRVGKDVRMGEMLSSLLHEIQHAVQTDEGFAAGWNRDASLTPEMRSKVLENVALDGGDAEAAAPFIDGQTGRDLTYNWMAGEVEARNTQKRQAMTAEQRRDTSPGDTADVPANRQIVVKGGTSTAAMDNNGMSPRAQRKAIAKEFGEVAFTKFNWLHKSVGTQYHKAEISPEFKRVFDTANAMESAGTLVAVRTAERAPGVLPKALNLVTAAKQLVLGRKAAKEMHAATTAILEGTTNGATVIDGKVWSDDELRSRFNLTDQGIALYRQMRASIDAGVFEVAAAEVYAMSALYIKQSERHALRELMIDDPAAGVAKVRESLWASIALSRKMVALKKSVAPDEQLASMEEMLRDQEDTLRRVDEVLEFAKTLAKVGYAPLMRFGKYTVTVQEIDPSTGNLLRDEKGEPVPTLYFERFETEAEAKDAYFNQGGRYAGMSDRIRISTGTVNEMEHKLYAGVSPEVVALFAEKVGSKAVEQLLTKVAVSDQSILKRQLNRKNIPGYTREYDRVLAKFVTSSGRWAASKYFMSDLKKSVKHIRERDVQAEAQKLVAYITDQRVDTGEDVAAAVSSLAFTTFLGGPTNVASAFVNFLQVGTLLPQHLVKTTSTAQAMAAIASAYRTAVGLKELPKDLRTALKKAEQEGKVDAQEVHHLYNIGIQGIQAVVTDYVSRVPGGNAASKALVSARYRLQAAGVLWGAMFGAVESLNRRVTFIAAWNVAKAEGLKDPFGYAIKAVDETQGIYTKTNRQNLGRSAPGRLLTTFKMVPAMWVEIMVRNVKYGGKAGHYAAALQLATLILLSGIAGLPFEDDLIDIIDTVGQAMGYNWNGKQAREKWAKETFGQLWGEAVNSGLSAFLPVDMGARLGVANLVPATGMFKKSNEGNRAREVSELFGVGGSLAMMGMDAFDAANAGRLDRAALAMAPVSIRNLAQGIEMATTGHASTPTGKNKADATPTEGAFKAVGFNPQSLAQSGQARFYESQNTALAKVTSDQILNDWAEGIATNNQKLVDKANADQDDWNRKNPDYPIYISADALRSKVKSYLLDADSRMLKATPKRWRGTVNQNLGLEDAGR
jgi:hypothetical protein